MKRDLTGEVVERASRMMMAAQQRIRLAVFAGPDRALMSKREALRKLDEMTPEQRKELVAAFGPERFADEVQKLMER